ncbi:MAG TPA: SMI1/KNR4 family protein [Cyanobacteria bacterium UBA11162]|nr:SMI1/KNR4 family protein [Cyanobacteria bacterium UBA11162]
MYLDRAKKQLKDLEIVSPDELSGCTHYELNKLERQLGIFLPKAYQEFLLWMGHGGGQFLRGSDCFFKHLPYLYDWGTELLQENNFPEPLPEDAFIFFMHQGYQFSFFRLSEGDNPPIYSYCEGKNQTYFSKIHNKFSEFMETEIELHAQYLITPSSY